MSAEPDTESVGGDTVHVMLRAIKSEPIGPAPAPPSPAPARRLTAAFERELVPRTRTTRRKRGKDVAQGLFTVHNAPILAACLACMLIGAWWGQEAVVAAAAAPVPNVGGPVQERRAITPAGYGGALATSAEEAEQAIQYTIYDGPLIKDPDGWYYVGKDAANPNDRYRFDPRKASRVVFHGNPPVQFIAFPQHVLVRAYSQLLVMLDLKMRLRSDYARQTGRGAPTQAAPRLTREQMEAETKRRLERELKTGEIYGTHYSDADESAPAKAPPRPGVDPRLNPDPRVKTAPKAKEPERKQWTDEKGVTRATTPPDAKKIQQTTPRPVD